MWPTVGKGKGRGRRNVGKAKPGETRKDSTALLIPYPRLCYHRLRSGANHISLACYNPCICWNTNKEEGSSYLQKLSKYFLYFYGAHLEEMIYYCAFLPNGTIQFITCCLLHPSLLSAMGLTPLYLAVK